MISQSIGAGYESVKGQGNEIHPFGLIVLYANELVPIATNPTVAT